MNWPKSESQPTTDPVAGFRVYATLASLLLGFLATATSLVLQRINTPQINFDSYALPVIGIGFVLMGLWLWLQPKRIESVHLVTLLFSATYVLLDLRISILPIVIQTEMLGAGAPWFPIIVVIAFLVLAQRTAMWFSALFNVAAIVITTSYLSASVSGLGLNTMIQFHAASIILTALIAIFGRMRHHYTEARAQAHTDALTGIQNRRAMQARLETAHLIGPYAVLLIDVDHFKQVNDQHGHAFGDIVLREIAFAINNHIRNEDYAARWGGEEFLVLADAASLTQARALGERLRRAVFEANPGGIRVTISIGIAARDEQDQIEDVLARADAALYRAKRAGRDQVRDAVTLEEHA
jgi:diguanylate cyclase